MAPTPFPALTAETAPPAAQRSIEATERRLGYVPSAVARLAASPELLNGFLRLSAALEASTLDPLAREVVVMTIATRNACHLCVAMHTAKLAELGADPELVSALRDGRAPADPRLAAVHRFTLEVIATAGAVPAGELADFLAHGHTPRNALEVVLAIGVYTMSTLANRLVDAPVDDALAPFAWTGLPAA
ncbi:carboxymuconolactone decarboxylase family protein [Nocardiopsis trehalosi]|jgi:AhpD family alkylhydroperoxidase|uniref:carboxymuconolactone decarboxylase family protein n=1 Tax=Nocardiopsis trehalosi TaxID=109329 RepID=UPI000829C89E|nr:carboxymuconolactone decarboxylase family protein [Nocardiopsis trehalosi]